MPEYRALPELQLIRGRVATEKRQPIAAARAMLGGMQALKARVENGRLKLDEPTDLPEGAEVDIAVLR